MVDVGAHDMEALDIRHKIAQIDLALAQHDRVRQEMRIAPWQLGLSFFTAGAAFFAAALAFFKLFG